MIKVERESFFKKIARFVKYNKVLLLFAILFFSIDYYGIFGDKGLINKMELEKENRKLEKQLSIDSLKNIELTRDINDLKNSDQKIEQISIEKYGLTKEKEKVYKVIIDSTK